MTEPNQSIGAFLNGVFLLALALSIFLQSMERFITVEVISSPELVLVVGCIGLVLNIIGAMVVHGKRQSKMDIWNA
jgi:zinc transporter 1